MNLARGPVGEFVLVMCRYRIAEHQRVYDPDCTWLHCLPHPDRPSEGVPCTHHASWSPSRGGSTPRKQFTSTGKTTLRTCSCGKRLPSCFELDAVGIADRKTSKKKRPRCA